MPFRRFKHRTSIVGGLVVVFVLAVALWFAPFGSRVGAQQSTVIIPNIPSVPAGSAYRQTNLVSDWPGLAPVQNPLLVNPWGLTATASSPFWVANNGTSTSSLVSGDVSGSPVVTVAAMPFVTIPGGLPTGTVANGVATEFVLPGPCASAPCSARFLFASITGNIVGWNPNAPAASSTSGVVGATHPGHVYTGLAIGASSGGNRLYAADFANGAIDVYDTSFNLLPGGTFADPTIPNVPPGNVYHPFNVQNIGGLIYVTYAKVDPITGLSASGDGNGFVRRFSTDGVKDGLFNINGNTTNHLNAPWGITLAPASFGVLSGDLLVGNFGEGSPSINAFSTTFGAFQATMNDESANPVVIDELWALKFGNGGAGGDINTLYFAAGIGEEEHGLFGSLKPTTATATSLVQFGSDTFAIGEGSGHIDITVTRGGDASGNASVNVSTFDESLPDH